MQNVFVDKDFTRLKEKVSFNLSAIDHGDTMKIARSSGVFIVPASSTLSIMIEGDGIRAVIEKFASRAGHLRIADLKLFFPDANNACFYVTSPVGHVNHSWPKEGCADSTKNIIFLDRPDIDIDIQKQLVTCSTPKFNQVLAERGLPRK